MKTTLFTLSIFVATTFASPFLNVTARLGQVDIDASNVKNSDANILAFALTLEQLETAFYVEGLSKFSASDLNSIQAGLYDNVLRLARDEATHVAAITDTLQKMSFSPPKPCQYRFPYTTPQEFIFLSAILEGVGASAYAGASGHVRSSKILSVAASILSVEARHAAILRMASGSAPYASAFDTPLDFNQAHTLAAQFIVPGSCPSSLAALNLRVFPSLAAKSEGASLTAGAAIILSSNTSTTESKRHVQRETSVERRARYISKRQNRTLYAAFLSVMGPKIVKTTRTDAGYRAVIPDDLAGQVYVLLINSPNAFSDKTTVAGPAIIEVAGEAPSSTSVKS